MNEILSNLLIATVCIVFLTYIRITEKSNNKESQSKQISQDEYNFLSNKRNIKSGAIFIKSDIINNNNKDCSYNRTIRPSYSNYDNYHDIEFQGYKLRSCKPFMDLLKDIYEETDGHMFNDTDFPTDETIDRIAQVNNALQSTINNIDAHMFIKTMDTIKNGKTYTTFVTLDIKNKQITNITKAYQTYNQYYKQIFVDTI